MSGTNRSGRPRKPLEIHKLHGSFRPDRHGPTPPAPPGSDPGPAPPAGEMMFEPDGPEAKEMFDFILQSPVGPAIRASDSPLLVLLAETWQLCCSTLDQLKADPSDKRARVAYLNYLAAFDRLCSRFGMSPTDRARLHIQPSKSIDEFDNFLTGVSKRKRN